MAASPGRDAPVHPVACLLLGATALFGEIGQRRAQTSIFLFKPICSLTKAYAVAFG
jgi:hypothetical protein